MRHYCKEEWNNYIDNSCEEGIFVQMEEHLMTCEVCLKQYVESLEENEIKKKTIVPINFVKEVMTKMNGTLENSKLKNKRKIFISYASAASITLFLMSSGIFTKMSTTIPMATAQIIHSPTKIEASLEKININNINSKFMNILKIKF